VYGGQLGAELPFDLVSVENDSGFEPGLFDAQAPDKGRFELGWDVARKGDISALWINHAQPGHPKHLRFLVLMQNCKFDLQRQVVREAMQTRLGGVGCGDATGLGMESNEVLRDTFGERWEPVDFGGKRKSELGSTLATTFGDGDQAIPPTDGPHKFIAADLYAIQKGRPMTAG
jgi:phage FluMu gp28-like protein